MSFISSSVALAADTYELLRLRLKADGCAKPSSPCLQVKQREEAAGKGVIRVSAPLICSIESRVELALVEFSSLSIESVFRQTRAT